MRHTRRDVLAVGVALAAWAGCVVPVTDGASGSAPTGGTVEPATGPRVGLPAIRASGNRVVAGSGRLDTVRPNDWSLPAPVAWIVGLPDGGPADWVAAGPTGRRFALSAPDGDPRARELPPRLPAGMPPVVTEDGPLEPPPSAAPHAQPLPLDDGGLAFVRRDGSLAVRTAAGGGVVPLAALPDARPVRVGPGRLAVLVHPTDRYPHGALGDDVEAGGLALVDLTDTPTVTRVIDVDPPAVVEGLGPIVDRGGPEPGLLVTVSDPDDGARVVRYSLAEGPPARGPAIGTGFRWRHVLAVAPFGPDGEREIAAVRTPHIGGTVEFYRRDGDELALVATTTDAGSHAIGSRVLDGGLAADLDGDGHVELLVPADDRRRLRALRRTRSGVTEAFALPVGGRLRSNVFARPTRGGIAVAVGREDGTVRTWGP